MSDDDDYDDVQIKSIRFVEFSGLKCIHIHLIVNFETREKKTDYSFGKFFFCSQNFFHCFLFLVFLWMNEWNSLASLLIFIVIIVVCRLWIHFLFKIFFFFFFILIWVFFSVFFSSKTFHLNFSMLFFLFCYLTIRWCCFDFALVTLFNWRFSIYRIQTLKIRMDLQVKLKNKKNLCNHIYIMWYTIVCLQMITWWLTQPKKKNSKCKGMKQKQKKTILEHYKHDSRLKFFFPVFHIYFFLFVWIEPVHQCVCVCCIEYRKLMVFFFFFF